MLIRTSVAIAIVAALATPTLAASYVRSNHATREPVPAGTWFVLQDAGGTPCYVADRNAGPDEGRLSGPFASERAAQQALGAIAACQSVNVEHEKDSAYSSG